MAGAASRMWRLRGCFACQVGLVLWDHFGIHRATMPAKSTTSHRTVQRSTTSHPPLDPTSIEEFLTPATVVSSSITTSTSLSSLEPSLLLPPSQCSATGLLPTKATSTDISTTSAVITPASSSPQLEELEQDWGLLVQPSQGTKRASWTRRLVVTKQPSSEFYKDEGGKANSLDVEVTLVEFNELGEPARSPDEEFIDIPLRILLFFESGKRVDDTDQEIFRFVGNDYDSVVIRAESRKASVQFRLEKVSRRKDGQRFKLRIEVDQEQCTANVADLTPIFTNAICVLSKRKHHGGSYNSASSDTAMRIKEPPTKLLKRGEGSSVNQLQRERVILCSLPLCAFRSGQNGRAVHGEDGHRSRGTYAREAPAPQAGTTH